MRQHFYKQRKSCHLWLPLKAFSVVTVLYLEKIKIYLFGFGDHDYDHDNYRYVYV